MSEYVLVFALDVCVIGGQNNEKIKQDLSMCTAQPLDLIYIDVTVNPASSNIIWAHLYNISDMYDKPTHFI